jgi:mRNA-degrading endonuclease RelE of RelBE toxin-antitoxin system
MKYKIKTIPTFDRQVKRLAKKYLSLKIDLGNLVTTLSENPIRGNALGKDCYKIRLSIGSKGKGKSGGARIITHLHISKTEVYLLSIYDKSEKENLKDAEINELLKEII